MGKLLNYLNLVFFLLMILVNALAEIIPLGIGKTGEISGKYNNLFTPAPITFCIWGVIYLLLGIFIFYQVFSKDNETQYLINNAGIWIIISCIMNIGWIFAWHYDKIALSVFLMLCLLISLIILSLKMTGDYSSSFLLKLGICGINIYLGWICVATIANISVLLVKAGWNRFGLSEQIWTIIILAVAALIGFLFLLIRNNYGAALAIIWALCGIIIKHVSAKGFAGKYPLIIAMALLGIVIILTTALLTLTTRNNVSE